MIYKNGVLISQGIQDRQSIQPQWRIADWFGDVLTESQLTKLSVYHQILLKFNQKINLVSDTTLEHADDLHFADSIIANEILKTQFSSEVIHDIGSGNGFPGIILALLNPDRRFVLVDKDVRKIEFIKVVAGRLDISNCSAVACRVEEMEDASIECAVSRAFAPLPKSLVMMRKKFKQGGMFLNLKTDSWSNEVSQIPVQVCRFWKQQLVGDYQTPYSKKHGFIVASSRIGE